MMPTTASHLELLVYTCRTCGKRYGRSDHLARHSAIHRQKPQLTCPYCDKKFDRADTRKRHIRAHEQGTRSTSGAPLRADVACDACSCSKARCDNIRPCKRCETTGLVCQPRPRKHELPPLDPLSHQNTFTRPCHRAPIPLSAPSACRTFDQAERDALLILLVKGNVSSDTWLPPPVGLDHLVEEYFQLQRSKLDSWIHYGTFAASAPLRLKALVVAAACMYRTSDTWRDLGVDICRTLQPTIQHDLEHDLRPQEALPLQQAFLLCIKVGFWSNYTNDNDSIDDLNMLIKAFGCSSRDSDATYQPPNDSWQAWIDRESTRRLMVQTYIQESKQSLTLGLHANHTILGGAELDFPRSNRMWWAESAAAWVVARQEDQDRDTVSSPDIVPENIQSFAGSATDQDLFLTYKIFILRLAVLRMDDDLHRLQSEGYGTRSNAGPDASSRLLQFSSATTSLQHAFNDMQSQAPALHQRCVNTEDLVLGYLSILVKSSVPELSDMLQASDGLSKSHPQLMAWYYSLEAQDAVVSAERVLRSYSKEGGPFSCFKTIMACQAGVVLLGHAVLAHSSPFGSQHSRCQISKIAQHVCRAIQDSSQDVRIMPEKVLSFFNIFERMSDSDTSWHK